MGDVARLSVRDEDKLYAALGINAELVIDHAWGWEPTEIKTINSYKPETNSISSGQVLMEPYEFDKARLIVKEMTELLTLDLVRKGVVTKKVELTIGYDRTSIVTVYRGKTIADSIFNVASTGKRYTGKVGVDQYGRPCPKHAHGTGNIDRWTNSTRRIMDVMLELYDRIIDKDLTVRRVTLVACNLIPEGEIPADAPEQLDLFTDYAALEKKKAAEDAADEKERRLQKTALLLQQCGIVHHLVDEGFIVLFDTFHTFHNFKTPVCFVSTLCASAQGSHIGSYKLTVYQMQPDLSIHLTN